MSWKNGSGENRRSSVALLTFSGSSVFGRAARESRIESLHAEREVFPNASPRSLLMYRKPSVCISVQPLYR